MTYKVGDDATITYPVTDTATPPGTLDIPATVHAWRADGTLVTVDGAGWVGGPAATRDLDVPLAGLDAGLWGLGLSIDGAEDLFLGNVVIE